MCIVHPQMEVGMLRTKGLGSQPPPSVGSTLFLKYHHLRSFCLKIPLCGLGGPRWSFPQSFWWMLRAAG